MTRRLSRGAVGGLVVAGLATVAFGTTASDRLDRAHRAAADVPLSPLFGDGYVGPDWPERVGVAGDPLPGEVDDLSVYARPDLDVDGIHPAVRRFYERTVEHPMVYRAAWHGPFRPGAALAARAASRIEQLNLPGPYAPDVPRRLESRIVAVDAAADPREGARAWVRTDAGTGEAVFVAVYASHERDGERYTNIAVPLPGGNLSTVLHLDELPTDAGTGLELTTRAPGDPGLYLATPLAAYELPMAQRFRVYPAGAGPRLTAVRTAATDPTLVATHEMWVGGRQFLTVEYAIEDRKRDGTPSRG